MEGTVDQLLLKARFEEAKNGELRSSSRVQPMMKQSCGVTPAETSLIKTINEKGALHEEDIRSKKCFSCGLEGHMKRDCSYLKQAKETEVRGHPTIATVTGGVHSSRVLAEEYRPTQTPTERRRAGAVCCRSEWYVIWHGGRPEIGLAPRYEPQSR